MAARDNQGMQAIIITLAILVFGLGAGMLFINNAKKTAIARAEQAEKSAQDSGNAERRAQEEANNYKEWMGFGSGESYEAMQKSIADDLGRFGQNFPEEERSYRRILEQMFEENRKLALNEASAKEQVKSLEERLLALEAQKQEQVKQYEAQMKEAAEKLAAETNNFNTQRTQMNAEKDKLSADFKALQEVHDADLAKADTNKQQLESKVTSLERSVDLLNRQIPGKDPFAQPADGAITWVNQRENRAWVNLGTADGLRPQVTFSVYTQGEPDAELAEKKASIEIVKLLGPHLAEAKVTGGDNKNPLLPGDKIYSPVWEPGRTIGFGIAGFIDIDGDSKSDLDLLKRIITAGGGKVDVAPNDKGAKEGQAQVETRFVILGTRPQDAFHTAWTKSWGEITNEANQLSIETIPLEEFLRLAGWVEDANSVSLAGAVNQKDFPPRPDTDPRPPKRTEASTGVFKPRIPKSAF